VIFAATSAWIGLAQDATMAILGRVAQGVGAALFIPPLYAITFETFTGKQQGFAMGLLGAAAGIGLAIGPSFGGIILESFGWRWIFYINVPLCVLTFIIIQRLVPVEPPRLLDESLDRVGAALLSIAMATLLYSLNGLANKNMDPLTWGLLGVGLVSLISFVRWQQKSEAPLIPLDILKNRTYIRGVIVPFFTHQFSFSVILISMGFYLQNVVGMTAYGAGLAFLALTLCFGVLSIYGGRLTDTMGLRFPAYGGLFVVGVGTLFLATLSAQSSLTHILSGLAVAGIGLGLCFSAFNTAMMKSVEPQEIAVASGFFAMFCLIAHSIAIVGTTSIIATVGSWYVHEYSIYTPDVTGRLCSILSCPHRDPDLFMGIPQGHEVILNASFMFAMKVSMGLCAIMTFVGGWLCFRNLHVLETDDEVRHIPIH